MSGSSEPQVSESVAPPAALDGLPGNWEVDGPVTTAEGSRYYLLTGTIRDTNYGLHRTVKLVAYQPPDGEWKAKGSDRRRGETKTYHEGTRDDCLRALVEQAERINADWAHIPGFEVDA